MCLLCLPASDALYFLSGSILGSGDERPSRRSQAEKGARASVQPTAHWVPAYSLRNAHGWYQVKTLQIAQSHGECLIWTTQSYSNVLAILIFYVCCSIFFTCLDNLEELFQPWTIFSCKSLPYYLLNVVEVRMFYLYAKDGQLKG